MSDTAPAVGAAEEGLRIREYAPPAGGGVQCTVTAEDDILIGRLAANLSGAKRIDLCICDERGVEQLRLPDIPIAPGASSVAVQESITFAKAAPSNKMIMRLVSFRHHDSRRHIQFLDYSNGSSWQYRGAVLHGRGECSGERRVVRIYRVGSPAAMKGLCVASPRM